MELLTAAQMRAIEQAAIDSGEVTGLELMERAGRGVVEAIFEEWPELAKTSHRAVVLCGPGNNGGDGFVVARLLKEWSWEVEVFLYGDPDKLPPDARVNYERWNGATKKFPNPLEPGHNDIALVVDALFGTGLVRPLVQELIEWWDPVKTVAYDGAHKVSVDIPSGLCSDSGKCIAPSDAPENEWYERFFEADLTVSFHSEKIGHRLTQCPEASGKVVVKPIGLANWRTGQSRDALVKLHGLPSETLTRKLVPFIVRTSQPWEPEQKSADEHKYAHGHALVLSGGPGKTGAARLAARGALRIGAGLVTIACPQQALWEVATHVTAIMCKTLDGPPGLREILEDDRLNALCLGPGLGLGADTQALVLEALKAKRATVLDADALTRFERNPQVLFDALHDKCVLTPHAGEFRRLFPDIADKLDAPAETGPAYSKVDATREAAARAGCTVLFKGPDTVMANEVGRCVINSSAYDRAAPWLATAGSGDVLAGFITGLLARGFSPMSASETAAWLHTECALSFGPGLIAEDLPEELPKVFRTVLAG